MTEANIIYYGNASDVREHLLHILNLLLVRPSTEQLHGFYISEKRYGKEILKKVQLFFENADGANAILIYRYLSDDEKKWLRLNPSAHCYVVLHNMLDLQYVSDHFFHRDDVAYLADYADSTKVRKAFELRKKIESKRMIRLLPAPVTDEKPEQKKKIFLPVTLLMLLNMVLNPAGELRRYSVILKQSHLRSLGHLLELFVFIHYILFELLFRPLYYGLVKIFGQVKVILIKLGYLVRHILLMFGFKSFGVLVDSLNLVKHSRVFLIKLGYLARHILLMLGFKSFGAFIDSINFLKRLRVALIKLGYLVRHILLMLGFKSFGVLVDSLNLVKHSRVVLIKLGYIVRHILLMFGFKSFGAFVDSINFLKRLRVALIRLGYLIRHVTLISFYKLYGFIVDSAHALFSLKVPLLRVGYAIRHILMMSYYKSYGVTVDIKNFILAQSYYRIPLFVKYVLWHQLKMMFYRAYGLIYDLTLWFYRILKLYLLWPVFKVYWFVSFQYNKRLKKYFHS